MPGVAQIVNSKLGMNQVLWGPTELSGPGHGETPEPCNKETKFSRSQWSFQTGPWRVGCGLARKAAFSEEGKHASVTSTVEPCY